MKRSTPLFLLAFLLFAQGCVTVEQNPLSGNKRAYGYTWAQEQQLGQEADQQIIQQYGLYDNAQLSAYVTRIGEKVLQESHLYRPGAPAEFRIPFTFRVLDSPVVNAFALPGGFCYVTRGLLSHLENEAQLAVVLGHEIGHVAGRHTSRRAANQSFAQIGLIGAAIGGQAALGGQAAETILGTGSQLAQLGLLRYGRDDERESDRVGVEYATMAGYQAEEGSEFFRSLKRITEASGQSIPSFMSTHPDPGEREATILQLAAQFEQQVPGNSDVIEREGYLRQIEGIVMGDDPRQGYTEGGAFYHPELRFQFPVPSGFQVINQPSQVVLSSEKAVMVFTFAQAASAQEAASAFAGQEGFTTVESGPTQQNGLNGYYVVVDISAQQGAIRAINQFIEYNGQVYSFLGYSTLADFSTYQNAFVNTLRSFAPLTDSRRINVQPKRLGLVQANRTAPFSSFVPTQLPIDIDANRLAIMNQVELNETIPAGTTIKIPR
ncbi:MAG: M48 family metalloprotease [Bacteroidota bacterium]